MFDNASVSNFYCRAGVTKTLYKAVGFIRWVNIPKTVIIHIHRGGPGNISSMLVNSRCCCRCLSCKAAYGMTPRCSWSNKQQSKMDCLLSSLYTSLHTHTAKEKLWRWLHYNTSQLNNGLTTTKTTIYFLSLYVIDITGGSPTSPRIIDQKKKQWRVYGHTGFWASHSAPELVAAVNYIY